MNHLRLLGLVTFSFLIATMSGQSASNHANSVNEPQVRIVSNPVGNLFHLVYNSPIEQTVLVSVVDAENHELYREKIKTTSGFIKPINFSQAPHGDYTVIVTGDVNEFKQELALSVADKPTPVFEADFETLADSRKVRLNVSGEKDGSVFVEVLDSRRKTIFSDVVKLDENSGRIFNLEKALTDEVIFRVYSESNVIEKLVALK
ncbi:MAG: hypothetical protein SF052_25755 [Bacteroidia bacterium]|nr:hypothetical protein [Bacteroidia bacterium]